MSFTDALPPWLLGELASEAFTLDLFSQGVSNVLLHGKKKTFWMGLNNITYDQPRCGYDT